MDLISFYPTRKRQSVSMYLCQGAGEVVNALNKTHRGTWQVLIASFYWDSRDETVCRVGTNEKEPTIQRRREKKTASTKALISWFGNKEDWSTAKWSKEVCLHWGWWKLTSKLQGIFSSLLQAGFYYKASQKSWKDLKQGKWFHMNEIFRGLYWLLIWKSNRGKRKEARRAF